MKEIVKKIIDKYGKEILLNSKKFISIFSDEAPSMKKEKKLLQIAFSENIGELFVNCKDSQREICIIKVKRKLDSYMSEEGLNSVLKGISYGLGWNDEYQKLSKNQNRYSSFIEKPKNDNNMAKNINKNEEKSTNEGQEVISTKNDRRIKNVSINSEPTSYIQALGFLGMFCVMIIVYCFPFMIIMTIMSGEYDLLPFSIIMEACAIIAYVSTKNTKKEVWCFPIMVLILTISMFISMGISTLFGIKIF